MNLAGSKVVKDFSSGGLCSTCEHGNWEEEEEGRRVNSNCPVVNGHFSGEQYSEGGNCWRPKGIILIWDEEDV